MVGACVDLAELLYSKPNYNKMLDAVLGIEKEESWDAKITLASEYGRCSSTQRGVETVSGRMKVIGLS
jgi:hypothetical protein